jgi:predicted NBD/HSP70 family sugar kinase
MSFAPVPPSPGQDRRRALVRTFETICTHGPLPRGDLSWTLGASPSTITASVKNLRRRGLVVESGAGKSAGGRPPMILDLAPDIGGVLAADIGGINTRVASADLRGRIVARSTIPTLTTRKALRNSLIEALKAAAAETGGPIRAIVLSVAGVVDAAGKVSLSTNIPGWPPGHPADWLDGFDCPVYLENNANLAALGEHAVGAVKGVDSVLFLSLGAGIGAGLLLNGELFRGVNGAAGEVGLLRTTADPAGPTLEHDAGADGIVRRYLDAGGDGKVTSAQAVFTRATAEEPAALTAIDDTIDRLAVGLANAISVLDPAVVVLGGGLAEAGDAILLPLKQRLSPLVPSMPDVVLSQMPSDAALMGAAYRAAQQAREAIGDSLARSVPVT